MLTDYLVQYGEIIGYVLAGVVALLGLLIVQLFRRRGDLKKARIAVRLASYSISTPRVGPIAVKGKYREAQDQRWIDVGVERVDLDGEVEVQRGTGARWAKGTRTYQVKTGDEVIAIGIMSKSATGWRLVTSPGEAGIQVLAVEPRPAPPPLLPWRAPLILAVWGAIGFFGLSAVGSLLADVPRDDSCGDSSVLRLQIASAMPQAREDALGKLARCHK